MTCVVHVFCLSEVCLWLEVVPPWQGGRWSPECRKVFWCCLCGGGGPPCPLWPRPAHRLERSGHGCLLSVCFPSCLVRLPSLALLLTPAEEVMGVEQAGAGHACWYQHVGVSVSVVTVFVVCVSHTASRAAGLPEVAPTVGEGGSSHSMLEQSRYSWKKSKGLLFHPW